VSSVLIIGASSDVARELARVYAKNGYDLLLCGRDKEDLQKQSDDLKLRYQAISVKAYHLDVIDFDSHEKFIDSLELVPDGVISVVGYLGDQIKAQKDFAEAKRIIDTNYTGVVSILERFADKFELDGLKVGETLYASRLYTPVNSVPGCNVTGLYVGTSPNPTGDKIEADMFNRVYISDKNNIVIS